MKALPHWRMLEIQVAIRALSRAWAKTGKRIAARMAIMAMTTSSSIRVKPGRRLRRMRAMTMFLLLKRSLARSPPAREFLLACLKLRLLWAASIGLGGTDVPAPDQRALAPPTGMAVAPRDE